MLATSRSARRQPTGRPERAASGPLTRSVQFPPLSSIQRPWASCLTISPTAGGAGLPGRMAGEKDVPSLGGGFCPP